MRNVVDRNWNYSSDQKIGNYPLTVGKEQCYTVKPTVIYTANGSQVTVLRKQMPIIADAQKDSVFYLFKDEEAARNSDRAGGTGFFVYIRSETGKNYFYAVTNRHVIEKGLAPVIRVNTLDGGFDTIPLSIYDWLYHPDGADVAAASFSLKDNSLMYFRAMPSDCFLTRELLDYGHILLGEEVYK